MDLNFSKFKKFIEECANPRWEKPHEKWPLRPGGGELYLQEKILGKADKILSKDSILENVRETLIQTMNAHVNLMSQFEFSFAKFFITETEEEILSEKTLSLLYGKESLEKRLYEFLEWAKVKPVPNTKKKKGINATVCSYFLGLSNPKKYPYCKPIAYKAAVDTLLTKQDRITDPVKRIIHCKDLYVEVLNFLETEYGLENGNLLDVHSLFYLLSETKERKLQYWLYAPGKNAVKWEEFYSEGVMGLGWDKLGDLNNYDSKEDITKKLQELEETETSKKNDATANYEFKEVISIGDMVIVKKGRGELLGYGEVKSDYYYDANRPSFQKLRKVNWIKKGNWKTNHSLALKTLTNITTYSSEIPGYDKYYEQLIGTIKGLPKAEKLSIPLNQILYGPPGTGKTYQTINYALSIIENKPLEEINKDESLSGRDTLLEKYKRYKDNGQIEFITFHQNYAYEDFIQGLRPTLDETNGSLVFRINDGVFKQITDIALENYKASRHTTEGAESKPPFRKVFDSYFEKLIEGEIEHIKIKMKNASYKITEIGDKSINFERRTGRSNHTFSISTLSEMYEREEYTLKTKGGLQPYYMPLLQELLTHAQSMSIDSIAEELKNYVIIIDEINRANISRVFGELITLIEDDKRFGGLNEMKATLPSSRDPFTVPPNLFIIGTMNTADKSIALIDIALRRRFDFIKLYPKDELVVQSYKELFNKINNQIVEKKGPDFQIGHAYFMKKPDQEFIVEDIMNKRVIPLLYEYFMNDGNTVNSILNEAGVKTVNRYGLWEFESFSNE